MTDGQVFAEFIDWRVEHPADDLTTELLERRVRRRDRHHAATAVATNC